MSNDFVLSDGGRKVDCLAHDIDDWRITFVDTGQSANIGQRLLRARKYLGKDEMFLANYADALTDMPLNEHIEQFRQGSAIASFVAVPTPQSFHGVTAEENGMVTAFGAMSDAAFAINAGYFCLRSEIFDYISEGDELVAETVFFYRVSVAVWNPEFLLRSHGVSDLMIDFDNRSLLGGYNLNPDP